MRPPHARRRPPALAAPAPLALLGAGSLALLGAGLLAGCRAEEPRPADAATPNAGSDAATAAALGDTLAALIAGAYDFSRPEPVARLMALYAPQDPVVSAAAGRVTTSRAALQLQIQRFWERVGRNMRDPRFVLGPRQVTVLGPDAAVLTTTYAIPHRTPEDRPHTLRGAWTAVFQRQGGRWVVVQEHLSDPAQP